MRWYGTSSPPPPDAASPPQSPVCPSPVCPSPVCESPVCESPVCESPNTEHAPLLPRHGLHGSRPAQKRKASKKRSRARTLVIVSGLLLLAALVRLIDTTGHRDLVEELVIAVEGLSSCAACKGLLAPLKAIAHLGDPTFLSTLMTLCVGLGIQDPDVCRGALGAQAPIIAHSLRSMSLGGPTGTLFCTKTFGLCEHPEVRRYDVPMPPPPSRGNATLVRPSVPARTKPLKVIHLSDLHIDREYTIGADAQCTRNLCCREGQPSDTPGHVAEPAGPYGHHNCDSPVSLYISMLRAMQEFVPDADFVIHTGDMIDHAVWHSVREDVEDGVGQGHSQFGTYLSAPLYGVIGNHDVAPTNSFPRNTTLTTLSSQWDLELFSETWQPWIGLKGAQSVRESTGCYSVVHPGSNLKVISLNTGLWYKANFWLYDSDSFQPDPNGIFAWLVDELDEAERKGQKAWIMGHLSPGKSDCLREPSRYLNQILRRYNATIAGGFYGHTHRAEFEIVYEDARHPTADTAMGIHYIGPAMTPESGNPAFRVYSVDPETYQVLDFKEYITDMSEPGFQASPRWFEYYSARDSYGAMLPPQAALRPDQKLDGRFWHLVTEAFETRYDYFQEFFVRQSRGGASEDVMPCWSGPCRAGVIRHLRCSESEWNGDESSAGLNIDDEEGPEAGEFDGTHTCGDLASLVKHAERRLKTQRKLGGLKIPQGVLDALRAELDGKARRPRFSSQWWH